MRLKIRCDGECEKFCKIFWEVNKALPDGNSEIHFLVFWNSMLDLCFFLLKLSKFGLHNIIDFLLEMLLLHS